MAKKTFWNFFRLGITGERDLFQSQPDTYFGVVIPASIASFYQGFVPTFLRDLKKPFVVDPMTYVFARDLNNLKRGDEIKKSFQKLISHYGKPWSEILSKRQLIPKDFREDGKWKDAALKSMAQKTLTFQKELLHPKTAMQLSLMEYTKMLSGGSVEKNDAPMFLVAPYFYFESTSDAWYEITLKMAELANSLKGGLPLYAVVCASKEVLLDDRQLKKISKDFAKFDGCIIWFSTFDEERDSEQHLGGIVTLLKMFDNNKKPVLMLYGGDFCMLLSKVSEFLTGFSRGICYGKSKDVDAETPKGGGAPKRYYYANVGTKLSESISRNFFSDNPTELCRCKICRRIMDRIKTSDDVAGFFDRSDLMSLREHFLVTHSEKLDVTLTSSKIDILKQIDVTSKKAIQLKARVYGIPTDHLTRWRDVLSQ